MQTQSLAFSRLLRVAGSLFLLLNFWTLGQTADQHLETVFQKAVNASGVDTAEPKMFPHPPPIADADPSIRHPQTVEIPTVMEVVRKGDALTVSFPKFQTTNLMVGFKMVTGFMDEEFVKMSNMARPRGISLGAFQPHTNVLTLGREGLPLPGQEFVFEHRITLFETDIPIQHLWTPQSGKHYKILWTRTFRETIK